MAQPEETVWRSKWGRTGLVAQPEETYWVSEMWCILGTAAGLFLHYLKEHRHLFILQNLRDCSRQSSISNWSNFNGKRHNSMGLEDRKMRCCKRHNSMGLEDCKMRCL